MLALVAALFCTLWPLDATASPQSDWQRFRAEYPYHIQTVALGAPQPDGRTLIVAEPPPWVTLAALQRAWPREFGSAVVQRHRIGVDGWVADIVSVLPSQSEDATRELVQQLSGYFFGTSYKSYAVPIGGPRPAAVDNLDVAVSTGQLAAWFGLQPSEAGTASQLLDALLGLGALITIAATVITRRLKWVVRAAIVIGVIVVKARLEAPPAPEVLFVERHGSRAPETVARILNGGGGLYDSDQRGLVLLVLPRSSSLDSYRTALREFVLDTDAILGAVGTDRATGIVGRERVVPVSVMPPLRVETLLQLASVKKTELAQSYERRNLFAGRFDAERNRDWAPIYLSAELKDTEYGSLLNITDQLLKSWSQHGEVRYANFEYETPAKYPFPVRLSAHAKASTITFNWNTKGVGYSDAIGVFRLIGFARTGALPVDYLGERDSRLRDAEDVAYEYFAASRDPNLARVVQYAGAYQIFRAFEIGATNPYAIPRDVLDRTRLQALAADVLDMLRTADPGRAAAVVPPSPRGRQMLTELRTALANLQVFHGRYGQRGDADLAAALIEPRAWLQRAEGSNSEYDGEVLELTYSLMNNPLIKAALGDELRTVALAIYRKGSNGDEANWIHTPAVVISWATGPDAGQTSGGHSLSSEISRFVVDDSIAAGNVRVIQAGAGRTILYSPHDKARIHATVRQAGRAEQQSPDALRDLLRQQLQRAEPRLGPVREVLKLGEKSVLERGLGVHAGVRVSPATWTHQPAIHTGHEAALAVLQRPGRRAIVIERQADGIVMTVHGESSTIFAPDTPSAIDAFVTRIRTQAAGTPPPPVDVTFTNFEVEQARGFIRSAQLHAPDGRKSPVDAIVQGKHSLAEIAKRRQVEWNLAAAKLESRRLNLAGDVVHTLEIPARQAASPLRLMVEATAEAASRVRALVEEFVIALRSLRSTDEVLAALREFVIQLKAIPGVKRVDTLQVQEAGDLIIVRQGGSESSHAAN
jgi:hypothetical protein